jgi:hypothetical protein
MLYTHEDENLFLKKFLEKCKWVCLTPNEQIFSHIAAIYFRWDDVGLVLDQHAKLDFYSTSSLKQQSVDKYTAQLVHIMLMKKVAGLSWFCGLK